MEAGFLLGKDVSKKAGLAAKVKNIEGKPLGKDGKPLKSILKRGNVNPKQVTPGGGSCSTRDGVVLDTNMGKPVGTSSVVTDVTRIEGSIDSNATATMILAPNTLIPGNVPIPADNKMHKHCPNDAISMNKVVEDNVKRGSTGSLNTSSIDGTMRDISSSSKIVKVATLMNEEKVLGAHVAIPLAVVNEISAKFDNTLYGYFIGSGLAFPIVKNYVCNAWAQYGFESAIFREGFFLFKFSSHEGLIKVLHGGPWFIKSRPLVLNLWSANTKMKKEDCKKVPVWVKIHKVPVVAFSEVGLSLITTQLGRPLMLDAHTSDLCLDLWGPMTYARVLIELSFDQAIMDSVIVVVPFPNGTGHSLDKLDVEYEWRPTRCSKCATFGHDDAFCPSRDKKAAPISVSGSGSSSNIGSEGGKQSSKAKPIHGIRLTKPKPNFVYRPVSKVSPWAVKTSSPVKEGNNMAIEQPCEAPVAAVMDSPRGNGKSTFIQDDLNLDDLRNTMDRLMEENKVLDINNDNIGSKTSNENTKCSNSSTPLKSETKKEATGSLWEHFKEVKKAATIDSESDEDEVYSPNYPKSNYIASASGEFTLEDDDLNCYDGYETQIYDLPDEMQKFCDHYDIRLNSRVRK
ncbi:zinc knuckle CX2CX4HX4C containing protein [Tanacetum coccineum]